MTPVISILIVVPSILILGAVLASLWYYICLPILEKIEYRLRKGLNE